MNIDEEEGEDDEKEANDEEDNEKGDGQGRRLPHFPQKFLFFEVVSFEITIVVL